MAPLSIFLRPGCNERLKGWAHGLLGMMALGCFAYNAGAWLVRREQHLAWNCVLYSGIIGFEIKQVLRHSAAASQQTSHELALDIPWTRSVWAEFGALRAARRAISGGTEQAQATTPRRERTGDGAG